MRLLGTSPTSLHVLTVTLILKTRFQATNRIVALQWFEHSRKYRNLPKCVDEFTHRTEKIHKWIFYTEIK